MKKVTIKKRLLNLTLITLLFFAGLGISNAQEPFIGEVRMFAGNFAPRGWAFCDGQLLPISQNTALFSLIGTVYGGDGRTTFALPDLRGRVPMHPGTGPGLSTRRLGQRIGAENSYLTPAQLPSHTHTLNASNAAATSDDPAGKVLAKSNYDNRGSATAVNSYGITANTSMAATAIGSTGASQAVNNIQPSLGVHYIIALVGLFPSRN